LGTALAAYHYRLLETARDSARHHMVACPPTEAWFQARLALDMTQHNDALCLLSRLVQTTFHCLEW